ncbi:MAG TPA: hypothetical protein VN444_06370, partial [Verrucomicrobiae bacterium]|nr:hypothetical protein [Verrucomicrobiae bacterium]
MPMIDEETELNVFERVAEYQPAPSWRTWLFGRPLQSKEPRSRNAGMTLIWMSAVLGTLFLGITFLAVKVGAIPAEQETVISQLVRTVFQGQGLLYLATIAGTTLILVMAANTAFADFPRLSALQAGDGFLPRQLTYRGSRLVFSRGIVALALIASLLI